MLKSVYRMRTGLGSPSFSDCRLARLADAWTMSRRSALFVLVAAWSCACADSAPLHSHAIPCESHPDAILCADMACFSHADESAADVHAAHPARRERTVSEDLRQSAPQIAVTQPPRAPASIAYSFSFAPQFISRTFSFPWIASLRSRAPPQIV